MYRLILPFTLIISLVLASCDFPEEPKDKVREITMTVSAETGVTYDLFDSYREHPIECMLVKYGSDSAQWVPLTFGSIEGFTYERGHEYDLRVRLTILANPPADDSSHRYSLIRIISDTKIM